MIVKAVTMIVIVSIFAIYAVDYSLSDEVSDRRDSFKQMEINLSVTSAPKPVQPVDITGSYIQGDFNITIKWAEDMKSIYYEGPNDSIKIGFFYEKDVDFNYTKKVTLNGWTDGKKNIFLNANRSKEGIISTCWHEKLHNFLHDSLDVEHRIIYNMTPNLHEKECEFIWDL